MLPIVLQGIPHCRSVLFMPNNQRWNCHIGQCVADSSQAAMKL
jgi:hypothetical protein